jgi:hypothetical protein
MQLTANKNPFPFFLFSLLSPPHPTLHPRPAPPPSTPSASSTISTPPSPRPEGRKGREDDQRAFVKLPTGSKHTDETH